MPPKVKVTRDGIIGAAVEVVRKNGAQALNARTVAAELQCSTQPIFSNFSAMDELREAVLLKADAMCDEYIRREVESNAFPPYKASGMAYIRFAKCERELFKFLYMRDRSTENGLIEDSDLSRQMETIVQSQTGLSLQETKLFHLEMWAYVHGIASMFATGYVDLDWDLVSRMLSDAYQGLRKQYKTED